MQYQVTKADVEAVVYCKAGAIEKVHCNLLGHGKLP